MDPALLSSAGTELAGLSGESVTYYKGGGLAGGVTVTAIVMRSERGVTEDGVRVFPAVVLLPRSAVTVMPTDDDKVSLSLILGESAHPCSVHHVGTDDAMFWPLTVKA